MASSKYPVVKDVLDTRDHLAAPPSPKAALPAQVSLLASLGPVKNQGQLGACTGFAFAGMREFLYRVFRKYERRQILASEEAVFSPLFLYYEERATEGDVGDDGGAQSRTGLQVLAGVGVCLESSNPYNPAAFTVPPTDPMKAEAAQFRIGAYHRVVGLDTLRSVLASGYVASLAIEVYPSFESQAVASTGEVPMPAEGDRTLGGHEVLAYGYDDAREVVLVRNSWGADWGDSGNFTLPYAYFDNYVMDMWTAHLGKPW